MTRSRRILRTLQGVGGLLLLVGKMIAGLMKGPHV